MALTEKTMKMLITEVNMMKESKHEAIIEYYDSYVSDNKIWVILHSFQYWK